MNSVSINGHLAGDAQIKYIGNKKTPCVSFSIGKSRQFTNERGNIEKKTMFFNIVIYGNYAKHLHPSLTKGSQVFIQGSLNYEMWEKEGAKHSKINIVAQKVYIFAKTGNRASSNPQAPSKNPQHNETRISGEDFMQEVQKASAQPHYNQTPSYNSQNHA